MPPRCDEYVDTVVVDDTPKETKYKTRRGIFSRKKRQDSDSESSSVRKSIRKRIENLGFASIIVRRSKNNYPTFAEQILAGPEGKNARRQSRSSYCLSSTGMNKDAKKMMDELSTSSKGTILADFQDDCEDHCEPRVGRQQPELKKTLSRRLSQTQLKQYGIEDEDADNIFVNTMGMENHKMSCSLHATAVDMYNEPFNSAFQPDDMRCLALVAHNHMKPAMRDFVKSHKEVLRKFRLTGTNTTITMLKEVFGEDPTVQYGPAFSSGPLGGDAELCALMCLQDLGGVIFFQDPLSAHPHQADIDCLNRLCNVHNVLTANNPCTAHALCFTLKSALENGRMDMIPSFFCTLKSPGVKVYQERQMMTLEAAKNGKTIF